jgi:hypothetical protein
MQARTLLEVTVSDGLRLLCGTAKKVIVTIDFFRLTFWCVVGVYCWPSAKLQKAVAFTFAWGAFHVEGG